MKQAVSENPLASWREALESWAIPSEIIDAAPEDPWSFPTEMFRRRAESRVQGPSVETPSFIRGHEVLDPGGIVLDVGAGAGAASLPLAPPAGQVTAVDTSPEMLEELLRLAASKGVEARAVVGRWPDVAMEVDTADVVVCHHVLYNAGDLEPFARALDSHARRRVVCEITERHPLMWMNDLWERFHGLERPTGPTAHDAVTALRSIGIPAHIEQFERSGSDSGFERRQDAVAFIRRRLCLPADRDEEVASALGDRLRLQGGLWTASAPVVRLATIWWDTAAEGSAHRPGDTPPLASSR